MATLTPPQPDESFGQVVVSGDDLNGDGFAEVLVGAPGDDGSALGKVYAYSGLDGSLLYTVDGRQDGDRFGSAVALASDFNLDGIRDFVVGAPSASTLRDMAGAVSVHSGLNGHLIAFFPGDYEGEQLGSALAAGRYLNDDDIPDIVAGAPAWDLHRGRVVVFSGANWQSIAEFKGDAQGDRFGESVALLDAVDSTADVHLAIGAPGNGAGYVAVYEYGNWERRHLLHGEQDGERFGATVALAGFANTNSSMDLAVASPGYRDKNGRIGRVSVFDLATGETVHRLEGHPHGEFGVALAAAGDMNGDALTDLLVVATADDISNGGAYLFSGQTGAELHHYPGLVLSVSGVDLLAELEIASDDDFADAVIGYPSAVHVVDCCDCSCHGDPNCNGTICDQGDVSWAIDVVFHRRPAHPDLSAKYDRTDVDCDRLTTITDIVRMIDVAEHGASPATTLCNPCQE